VGQADQLAIGELPLGRDDDYCGRVNQEQEMIEHVRDVDEADRARGEPICRFSGRLQHDSVQWLASFVRRNNGRPQRAAALSSADHAKP
jgi:hypothetical protein